MEVFLGTILLWPINFAPRNWAFCHGQLLLTRENPALFGLLGITYGGDGRQTFGLPDLRGRVPVGIGSSAVPRLGVARGSETVTLGINEIPGHSHAVNCNNEADSGDSNNPSNNFPGVGQLSGSGPTATPLNMNWASALPPNGGSTMNINTIEQTGGGLPHDNMQPSLGLNFIIALVGIRPSRN